jgi:hypothetical protein
VLATPLRHVLDALPDGGRALVVGHSPTNGAAVLGLVGEIVKPISKSEGRAGRQGGRIFPSRTSLA